MRGTDQSMPKLDGKVAVVTGASRGIGLATATALADAGATVVGLARTMSKTGELARRLDAIGRAHLLLACDVSDQASVSHAAGEIAARFGGIDVLVNNAGVIDPIGRVADTDPSLWLRSIAVNLNGAYLMTRAALPSLLERRGTVINISSGAALQPFEGWSAYCSGKAGLAMLTKSLAFEYEAEGLRVFGFQPGTVDTRMQDRIRASGINEVSTLKREELASPDDLAQHIVYLCTPEADTLSGQELTADDTRRFLRAQGVKQKYFKDLLSMIGL